MKADQVKGHLDLALLAVIGRGPAHGYAVITTLREDTDGLLDLTEGSVYPALHRLEDLGWLASEWGSDSGRRRRVYRLTPDGASRLQAEHRDWRSLVDAMESLLRRHSGPATVTA